MQTSKGENGYLLLSRFGDEVILIRTKIDIDVSTKCQEHLCEHGGPPDCDQQCSVRCGDEMRDAAISRRRYSSPTLIKIVLVHFCKWQLITLSHITLVTVVTGSSSDI